MTRRETMRQGTPMAHSFYPLEWGFFYLFLTTVSLPPHFARGWFFLFFCRFFHQTHPRHVSMPRAQTTRQNALFEPKVCLISFCHLFCCLFYFFIRATPYVLASTMLRTCQNMLIHDVRTSMSRIQMTLKCIVWTYGMSFYVCLFVFFMIFHFFNQPSPHDAPHLYLPHPTSTMSRAQTTHQNLSFGPKVYFFAFLFFVYFYSRYFRCSALSHLA